MLIPEHSKTFIGPDQFVQRRDGADEQQRHDQADKDAVGSGLPRSGFARGFGSLFQGGLRALTHDARPTDRHGPPATRHGRRDDVGAIPAEDHQRGQGRSHPQVIEVPISVQRQKQQRRDADHEERVPSHLRSYQPEEQNQHQKFRQIKDRQPLNQDRPVEVVPHPSLWNLRGIAGQIGHQESGQWPGQEQILPAQEGSDAVVTYQHDHQRQQAEGHERRPERAGGQQDAGGGQKSRLPAELEQQRGIQPGRDEMLRHPHQRRRIG